MWGVFGRSSSNLLGQSASSASRAPSANVLRAGSTESMDALKRSPKEHGRRFGSNMFQKRQQSRATSRRRTSSQCSQLSSVYDEKEAAEGEAAEKTALVEATVAEATLVAFFLTKEVFAKQYLMTEALGAALQMKKPLLRIFETDPRHNAVSLNVLEGECPTTDLSFGLFGKDRKSVQFLPWHRVKAYAIVTLKKVVQAVVTASRSKVGLRLARKEWMLLHPKEQQYNQDVIRRAAQKLDLRRTSATEDCAEAVDLCVYGQSLEVKLVDALQQMLPELRVLTCSSRIGASESTTAKSFESRAVPYFLLYLNKDTFSDQGLCNAVRDAYAANSDIKFVLVHEKDYRWGGVPFAKIMEACPQPLYDAKIPLFRNMAVEWYDSPEYQQVSLTKVLTQLFDLDEGGTGPAEHESSQAFGTGGGSRC